MFTKYYTPHPALEEYVETICIISQEFVPGDLLSPIYTFMPSHTRFLCFYLEDPVRVKKGESLFVERARSIIIGPQLTPVTLNLGRKHTCVIVVLKPCALYRLLGIPLKDMVDCDFDARQIIGSEIQELTERLIEVAENDERNSLIQKYLLSKLSKLKPAHHFDKAMWYLVKNFGNISMDFLASQSCLCNRQMERQSLERIGFSPKFFARMIRFSEAYKYKERNPDVSWTKISQRFEYYDQMHLIRDFRSFTGTSPSSIKDDKALHSVKLSSLTPS